MLDKAERKESWNENKRSVSREQRKLFQRRHKTIFPFRLHLLCRIHGLSLQKYYYSHKIKFSVTLQQKQQKRNTTMYSKHKLIFIPKTIRSKQSLVLLSKKLRKHIHIYNKENRSNVNQRDLKMAYSTNTSNRSKIPQYLS